MVKKTLSIKDAKKADAPAKPVSQKRMTRRFNKLRLKDDGSKKGIVYLGHLPKGFDETSLRKYFVQFGKIKKLRVSRSKTTARSRGYAFVQFEEPAVAQIAQDTMDKYLIFGRQIQAKMMEPELVHKDLFKNGNREWKFVPKQSIWRDKKNAEDDGKTDEQRAAKVTGLLEKEKERRTRLKELGIEYEFNGYQALVGAAKASRPVKAKKESAPVAAASKDKKKIKTKKTSK